MIDIQNGSDDAISHERTKYLDSKNIPPDCPSFGHVDHFSEPFGKACTKLGAKAAGGRRRVFLLLFLCVGERLVLQKKLVLFVACLFLVQGKDSCNILQQK